MEELTTKRHRLRRWRSGDAESLYAYAKDPRVGPNAGWAPHASIDESRAVITMFQEANDGYAIVDRATDQVIGSFGMHTRRPVEALAGKKQVEFGFVLHPDYWGQGRMPEIVDAALAVAFVELEMEIVWSAHFDFNGQSQRVIEKMGFRHVLDRPFVMERIDGRTVTSRLYRWTRERYEAERKRSVPEDLTC